VADIFREHAALSGFENTGARDFDIGACAMLDDAAYESLQPFVWGGGPDQRFFGEGGFFHADRRARFIAAKVRPPVNAPDESRPGTSSLAAREAAGATSAPAQADCDRPAASAGANGREPGVVV
jgi:hypothetical protein